MITEVAKSNNAKAILFFKDKSAELETANTLRQSSRFNWFTLRLDLLLLDKVGRREMGLEAALSCQVEARYQSHC